MGYLKRAVLFGLFVAAFGTMAGTARAAVSVDVGIGLAPAPLVVGPPVCEYGYYPAAPYACGPYYGPDRS